MEHRKTDRPTRDQILDAWRGISVLLVVLSHLLGFRFASLLGSTPPDGDVWASTNTVTIEGISLSVLRSMIGSGGTIGVRFFFVISGYIITTLLVREYRRNSSISLPAFYVRRAFRILPPLALIIGFALIMRVLGVIEVGGNSLVTASTFLCNTSFGDCGWFLGHLWSLGVEEQFYIAWPLLLVSFGARTAPRLALSLLILFLLLAQLSLLFVGWINNGLNFACIAAGALYATSPRFQDLIAKAASIRLVVTACALLFGRPLIPLVFPGQYRMQDIFTPFLICFIIFSCFRYRALLEKRLLVRWFSKLGLISYSLYLWQQFFLASPDKYLKPSLLDFAPLGLLFAVVSYLAIERPLIRLGGMLSRKLQGNTLAAE